MAHNAPEYFTFDNFALGMHWDSQQVPMPKNALSMAKNFNITRFGTLEKRKGLIAFGVTHPGGTDATKVLSLIEYNAPNSKRYLVAQMADGYMKYYTDGTWSNFSATTISSTNRVDYAFFEGYLFGSNGINKNFKILNTTPTTLGVIRPKSSVTIEDKGSGSGMTGTYRYVWAWKRSATDGLDNELISNYSPISNSATLTDNAMSVRFDITTLENAPTGVDYLILYRTLDLGDDYVDDDTPTQFYKVVELPTGDADERNKYDNIWWNLGYYFDTATDNEITTLAENDNNRPPQATFVETHKNRMFYANLPLEDGGGSKIVWSKIYKPEAVPSTNYQYFDQDDGEDITGIVGFGDYLVVFKRNKIGYIEGEFEEFVTLPHGVGCVSPWTILHLDNEIVFLSEEGWKGFDGSNIYDLSSNVVEGLHELGYIRSGKPYRYSAAYHPGLRQMRFLLDPPTVFGTARVLVGHFLVPLLYIDRGIPESERGNLVAWTYHQYDSHNLSCLANYTDSTGITRIMAGDESGNVWKLDIGDNDETNNIAYDFATGWVSLGVSQSLTKTIRIGTLALQTDLDYSHSFNIDKDYVNNYDTITVSSSGNGSYCNSAYCNTAYCSGATGNMFTERMEGTGQLFRFGLSGTSTESLAISGLTINYRIEGVR